MNTNTDSITISRDEWERYCNGHKNRLYGIPIIQDNSDVIIGDRATAWLGRPDKILGYRFYVEQDDRKWIVEVRSTDSSDYNIIKFFYRDWDERDVMRSAIDPSERLEP